MAATGPRFRFPIPNPNFGLTLQCPHLNLTTSGARSAVCIPSCLLTVFLASQPRKEKGGFSSISFAFAPAASESNER